MTAPAFPRSRLLAPLVYLAGLVFLLEEWFWHLGLRIGTVIGRLPVARLFERLIQWLPPYAALCAFVLPGLLLIPVKLLALLAIAHGHAASGIAVFLVAKLAGAALVARIYTLSLPKLLTLAWFARWHGVFVALKNHHIARLRASALWLRAARVAAVLRARARHTWRRLRGARAGQRHAARLVRILRRLAALRRARAREKRS